MKHLIFTGLVTLCIAAVGFRYGTGCDDLQNERKGITRGLRPQVRQQRARPEVVENIMGRRIKETRERKTNKGDYTLVRCREVKHAVTGYTRYDAARMHGFNPWKPRRYGSANLIRGGKLFDPNYDNYPKSYTWLNDEHTKICAVPINTQRYLYLHSELVRHGDGYDFHRWRIEFPDLFPGVMFMPVDRCGDYNKRHKQYAFDIKVQGKPGMMPKEDERYAVKLARKIGARKRRIVFWQVVINK